MFAMKHLGVHDVFQCNYQCHLSSTFLALSGTVKRRFISFACGVFKSTGNRILLVSTRGRASSVGYHAMSVNRATQIRKYRSAVSKKNIYRGYIVLRLFVFRFVRVFICVYVFMCACLCARAFKVVCVRVRGRVLGLSANCVLVWNSMYTGYSVTI